MLPSLPYLPYLPKRNSQRADKPNSVRLRPTPFGAWLRRDDHSSCLAITGEVQRPTRKLRTDRPSGKPARLPGASLFGLAPCGVLPATDLTAGAVRSYRTFSPLPLARLATTLRGGIFSVPLSFRSPWPDVIRRTVLRSSDFPLYLRPCERRWSGRLARCEVFIL